VENTVAMKTQYGLSLLLAIAVLVILGIADAAVVRLNDYRQTSAIYAVQAARAYYAAKTALDWGQTRLFKGASCMDITAHASITLPGFDGFRVRLTC
jgi:MSHA biogenesis protein MshP